MCFQTHHYDHVISLGEHPIAPSSIPISSYLPSLYPQILPKLILVNLNLFSTWAKDNCTHFQRQSQIYWSLFCLGFLRLCILLIVLIRLYYVLTQFSRHWILTVAVTYSSL